MKFARFAYPGIAVLALATASCDDGDGDDGNATIDPRCETATAVRIAPSADDTATVQGALINAQAGSTVCLDNGTYHITEGLSLTVMNVTVLGTSPGRGAVLDFKDQAGGAETFLVTSDGFTIENLTIKNARGDGVVVRGAENVTFRNLYVFWDAGSVTANGAYGIFPGNCDKVPIQDTEVLGPPAPSRHPPPTRPRPLRYPPRAPTASSRSTATRGSSRKTRSSAPRTPASTSASRAT